MGELPGSVFHGKTRGLLGGTEGFPFPGHDYRDPVNWARYAKGGARCPEGCLWLGAFPRMRGPTSGLKLTSRGSDKSHLLGASPLFFHP